MTKENQGPTLGVPLTEASVKRELKLPSVELRNGVQSKESFCLTQ